jgi:predicted XRE-type DNA-binding protein
MASKKFSLKRQIASSIVAAIASKKLSQRSVAQICGVSQPRISNLASGQLEQFSIDSLADIAEALGCQVMISVIGPQELDVDWEFAEVVCRD